MACLRKSMDLLIFDLRQSSITSKSPFEMNKAVF